MPPGEEAPSLWPKEAEQKCLYGIGSAEALQICPKKSELTSASLALDTKILILKTIGNRKGDCA